MTNQFPLSALRPVDASSPLPAHMQISDQLKKVIDEHQIPHGTQLPIEAELVIRFGVSRTTLREAMRTLGDEKVTRAEGDGVVVVIGGSAAAPTFSADHVVLDLADPRDYAALVAALHDYQSRLQVEVDEPDMADPFAADAEDLEEQIVRLRRMRQSVEDQLALNRKRLDRNEPQL